MRPTNRLGSGANLFIDGGGSHRSRKLVKKISLSALAGRFSWFRGVTWVTVDLLEKIQPEKLVDGSGKHLHAERQNLFVDVE